MSSERQPAEVQDLNLVLVGHALVHLAMISRLMGHSDLESTARDYLLPHDGSHRTPEQEFVLKVVTRENPVTEEEAIEYLQDVPLASVARKEGP